MGTAHLLYALAWLSFGLGHSVLATAAARRRLRVLGRCYRLAYNGFALAHFAAVGAVGAVLLGDAPPLPLPDGLRAALGAVHLVGWGVLLLALRYYDLGRLAGTAQIRGVPDEDEPLRLDGPHRWVRHPLYAGAYLILWGAAQTPLGLATAVWGSLYLMAGTWFEERKLLARYGTAYADYRRRVPAVVPWRGRVL